MVAEGRRLGFPIVTVHDQVAGWPSPATATRRVLVIGLWLGCSLLRAQGMEQVCRFGDPAHDAALGHNHLQCGCLELREITLRCILN